MASGKTTVADYLIKNHGYTLAKIAEPLYSVVNNLDTLSTDDIYHLFLEKYAVNNLNTNQIQALKNAIDATREIPLEEPKPRKRLQFFGTEGARGIDINIWVNMFLEETADHPELKFVTDDVRFANEVEAVKANDCFIIKLEVNPKEQEKRIKHLYGEFDPAILTHASEVEIEGFVGDVTINANQPLKDMLREVSLYLVKH